MLLIAMITNGGMNVLINGPHPHRASLFYPKVCVSSSMSSALWPNNWIILKDEYMAAGVERNKTTASTNKLKKSIRPV